MKKFLISILLISILLNTGFAQFEFSCGTILEENFPQELLLNESNCVNNKCDFYKNHADDLVSQTGDKIKIRTNIIIMQRNDGTGNFDIDNPSHLTYLENVFSYLNSKINNLLNESCDYDFPCLYYTLGVSHCAPDAPLYYPKLNVEFVPNFIEIKDNYGWNHRNDNEHNTESPFLKYIFNLAKQSPSYITGINVILTEDADAWQYIDNGQNPVGIVSDIYNGNAYSMAANFNNLEDDYLVLHFPNLYSGKILSELYYGSTEEANKIKNAYTMIHEYGHMFLGLYHTDCTNDIMNLDGGPQENYKRVITGCQARQWYLTMMTSNIRNVIECDDFASLSTLTVDTDEIWTDNFKILGDIIIKSGKSLTVKCELNFMPQAKIYVGKGAKLIIDGGKLTSNCGSKWEGIIVAGDPTKDQTNPSFHGIVETKNGAIIENAACGIGNHKFSNFLNNSGGIIKCDNTSFINCDNGIRLVTYKFENEGYVNNCSFNNSEYGDWGIYLNEISSFEIKGSSFEGLQRGIFAINSKLEVKQFNIFRNISEAGIASLATSPGASSLVVTENNHFIGCYYGITLSGNTANALQEISENYFENCYWAVDIDGDNNYLVENNRFNSCNYGVLSWASGDFVNNVKCNEMLYTKYGNIYMLFRNSQSSFLGNNFLESEAGPYKFDFRAQNATIAMEQGNEEHPAMNYFWSTDDIETENSDHFNYYIPLNAIPRTDPQNPGNYTEKNSEIDNQLNCGTPPVPVVTDVQIRLLKDEYCRILQLYRANPGSQLYKKMFYQISRLFHLNFYYWSIQNELSLTWEKIDQLLSKMCGYKWKIRRYGLNLYHGDIAKAESILNELDDPRLYEPPIVPDDLSDESRISFITTQRINLRHLRADSTFQFTKADISVLSAEAVRNIPERAYARSLYTLATGELLPRVLPEEGLQPRESKEMVKESVWSFSPNPASNTLNVNYMGKGEISGKISVYSTDGRLMLDIPARFSGKSDIELNVSSLESGIYMMSLTDDNNTVIFKDKFIKIK